MHEMVLIKLKPILGIEIQGIGDINLDQDRKDVEKTIGPPNSSETRSFSDISTDCSFYDIYELRIDYDDNHKVEFIEFIGGPFPTKAELSIYEINPFRTDAAQLIEILSYHNSGKINAFEAPYSFAFENISVGVWRQSTPSDIQKLIIEKNKYKHYDNDRVAIELEKSSHFWTIGIGRKDYYSL